MEDRVDNPVSLYAATKKSNELFAHCYSKLYDEQDPQPMPLMPMPKEEFQMVMELAEKPIWGRSIVGSADVPIAALIEKLNIADWVRQGQLKALRRNSEVCPFCQQKTVTKDFRKQLNDFFDQNYLADLQRITDECRRYAEQSAKLVATLEEVAAEARMDKEGNRGKWYEVMNADQFTVHVEKLKASLETNHQRMAEKVKNPGMKVEFNDIRTTLCSSSGAGPARWRPAEGRTIVTSFARWYDQGSHDIFDDLFVENPRSMNEKYMSVFKRLFVVLGHEAHYKMMMRVD